MSPSLRPYSGRSAFYTAAARNAPSTSRHATALISFVTRCCQSTSKGGYPITKIGSRFRRTRFEQERRTVPNYPLIDTALDEVAVMDGRLSERYPFYRDS